MFFFVDACTRLRRHPALLDGESPFQDENGISDFDALRSAIFKAAETIAEQIGQ